VIVKSIAEERLVLVAENLGILRSRRAVEVEEDAPDWELVGLAPDLGLVEEGTFVVELGECDGVMMRSAAFRALRTRWSKVGAVPMKRG
jgi:hypothetical protein